MLKILWLVVFALLAVSCSPGSAADDIAVPSSTAIVPETTVPAATTTTASETTTTTTIPQLVEVVTRPRPTVPAPTPMIADGFAGVGTVTLAAGGAALYEELGTELFVVAREGLVFPAHSMRGEWIEVFTSCDAPAWVHASEVLAQPPAAPAEIGGAGFDFANAVIVVDPGHGGPWNTGAVSPSGLVEKDVNLDIARRVGDLLRKPHDVDWDTGTIYVGDGVPAVDSAILTRVGDAESGDYEAGLIFRSDLANAANAHAMVAIHNNAGWEIRLDAPGSDVYYQSQIVESRRFAKLMVDELLRSFAGFEADWVGTAETGAKSRLSPREDNPQYYGILRRSEMPTVITEGVYIANQSEADLLATPEFRQAYAEGIYRALVRFLTTDDTGDAADSDPVIWAGSAGSGDARPDCIIPAQETE